MERRVVITGLGTVTGLGVGMAALWEGLCAEPNGRTALRPITRFDASGYRSRLGAEINHGFSAKDYVPKHYRKAVKVMARDIELAVAAAKFAVEEAGLVTRGTLAEGSTEATTYAPERVGCHIGAGLIAAEADELATAFVTARRADDPSRLDLSAWGSRGMENLTPLWLLKYLPNMLACHVTIIHGCEGPSNTITCAEASGLLSVGESTRVIQRGDADLCFSGGAESKLNLMGLLRLEFAGRLATTGEETDGSVVVRPFDPGSPGGLLGEAGGIVILEEREGARKRGARVYAEVTGIGASHAGPAGEGGEAGEAGEACEWAIRCALEDAGRRGVKAGEIDAVVPMGCGCAEIDTAEAGALERVFGSRLAEVPLVTLAPMIGSCAAGTGGVQVAVAAKALAEQRLPARMHAGSPRKGLMAGRAESRPANLRHVLVVTGSAGGQNAAVVLTRAAG